MGKSYQEEYRSKLITADQAAALVKNGDWVHYCHLSGKPVEFDEALAKRVNELYDVNLKGAVTIAPEPKTVLADLKQEHWTWNASNFSAIDRKFQALGNAYYIPWNFHDAHRYVMESFIINIYVTQARPMDEHGYFNLSIQACFAIDEIEKADIVIIETNDKLPHACGGYGECVHISKVDYIIEGKNLAPVTLPEESPEASPEERKIAEYILDEIEDGCCIQLGIGAFPNYIGTVICEGDFKHLGIHSEMFADCYPHLIDSGMVDNSNKTFMRNKSVYAFALGKQSTYDYIHFNPGLAIYDVSWCNRPDIIASNPKVRSVNNCVGVDLYAQVASESWGFKHISGTGGAADFVRGAYDSEGGKSYLCMTSTKKDKAGNVFSSIVPTLPPGTIVTIPRYQVQYLVTEYGKVGIKGYSTWQVAEKMISIAHPDFRDELVKEAQKMNIWRRSNKIV
ncbi:MAG TPA: acetyl-CoA hydrolase/transferase C-terminal domain-containing protein [Syntrophomonas sp.]|jgi:acyl-CoA hydrolase|nr:acetyl-CoA hydrolase/transferase C-terminal domain-containing protein [Syntrophomonas sp.]